MSRSGHHTISGVTSRKPEKSTSPTSDHAGDVLFSSLVLDSTFPVPVPPEAIVNDLGSEFSAEAPTNRTESLQLERRGVTSHRQEQLWDKELVFQQSILSKLMSVGKIDIAGKMATCHTVVSYQRCQGCGKAKKFFNRCELFFCPVCAPRLSFERKEQVEWWTREINQPKHVVLTVRNTADLTKPYVQFLKSQLAKLRRSKVFSAVTGGFYTLEVTNEGRGWHVHFHLLVNARWIDASELAIVWGKLVGQDYAIVKIKDCRQGDYLREVTKYAVKGSELASFTPQQMVEFITAFDGVRFFGVFGDLYGKRTEYAEWIASLQEIVTTCECGCTVFKIMSEQELQWLNAQDVTATRPPPPVKHPELKLDDSKRIAGDLGAIRL